MKDLYTFDSTQEKALKTYETVRRAYSAFFDEFKIPYLVAEADSGDIGGNLSHEYQILSQKGEDNVICCTSCSYVANEEMATSAHRSIAKDILSEHNKSPGVVSPVDIHQHPEASAEIYYLRTFPYKRWIGVSKDRSTIFVAIFPAEIQDATLMNKDTQRNPYVLKKIFEDLDPSVEDYTKYIVGKPRFRECFDYRLPQSFINDYHLEESTKIAGLATSPRHDEYISSPINPPRNKDDTYDLIKIQTGDACPKCSNGILKVHRTIELGHTFHLGTRYSAPLNSTFATNPNSTSTTPPDKTPKPPPPPNHEVHFQMGCHGIGISRIIAAIADSLADSTGLNWPRVIAPFEAIIIPARGLESAATEIYDRLLASTHPGRIDAILDDRDRDLGWKLKDADLIGYPIILVVGRAWRLGEAKVEVQCRRLGGWRGEVGVEELGGVLKGLLERL